MKNRLLLLLLFVGLQTLLSSCQQDDTAVFNAQKVVGNWTVIENSTLFGSQNYTMSVSYDETNKKLLITNFFGLGTTYVATGTFQDDFTITIPEQTIGDYKVSGKGSVSSDYKTIDWAWSVIEGTNTSSASVTANCSKNSTAKSMDLSQKR